MRITVLILFLAHTYMVAIETEAASSGGTIITGRTMESGVLSQAIPYSTYLPKGYDTTGEDYPVLYLLHGGGGNELSWINSGNIKSHIDSAIAEKILPPVILIMPAANRSRYINNYDGSVLYEDFFIKEFVPYVDSTYNTLPKKQGRILIGSSMGGYGSVVLAMKHPETFSASVSFMGSFCEDDRIRSMSVEEWNTSTRGPVYGLDLVVGERFTTHYRQHDPCHILEKSNAAALKTVAWYLDCGDEDFRISGNMRLFRSMQSLSIPIELRVRDGGHNMNYVQAGLEDAFGFVARTLTNKEPD